MERKGSHTPVRVRVYDDARPRGVTDRVAVEEPLEIRLPDGPLVVTMRTPGHDAELAAGFLWCDGILPAADSIAEISHCTERRTPQAYNEVTVRPRPGFEFELERFARRTAVTSACGVCGKSSLEALELRGLEPVGPGPRFSPGALYELPHRLREGQETFDRTGGLHAAALVGPDGELVCVREDVGRHNALDKVAGWALLNGRLPADGHAVAVSGRASFELVQKAVAIGAGMLCAVSAPSSLAVQTAERFGLTLVGFLRDRRFVVYSHPERLADD